MIVLLNIFLVEIFYMKNKIWVIAFFVLFYIDDKVIGYSRKLKYRKGT